MDKEKLHSPSQGNYKEFEESKGQYCAKHAPRSEYHIYIVRSEINFDIDAQLDIISSSRNQGGNNIGSLVDGTSKYLAMFERWFDRYLGLAKGMMSAFVVEPQREGQTDFTSTSSEVDITLMMPDYWDSAVMKQLTDAIHEYIVNGCLSEYCSLTLTSKDPVTIDKAERIRAAALDIKRFVNFAKPGSIHKVLKPF